MQNSLADAVGAEQVLNLVLDTTTEGSDLTFTPETGGEYYAYVGNKKIEKVTATTWKGTKTFTNVDRGYLLELGYCAAGEAVTLTAEDSKEENVGRCLPFLRKRPWLCNSKAFRTSMEFNELDGYLLKGKHFL